MVYTVAKEWMEEKYKRLAHTLSPPPLALMRACALDQISEHADVSLLDSFFLPPVRCVEGLSILKALPPSSLASASLFAAGGGGRTTTPALGLEAAASR